MCDSRPTAKKVTAKGRKTATAAVKGKPAPRKQACAKKSAGAKPATAKRKPAALKTPTKKAACAKPASAKRNSVTRKNPAKKIVKTAVEPVTDPSCVVFESNTGIAEVRSLHTVLAAALDNKTDIILDASNVETADTAVLQLLSAFTLQARKGNLDVRWKSPSDSLLAAARLLDLDQQLGLPVVRGP